MRVGFAARVLLASAAAAVASASFLPTLPNPNNAGAPLVVTNFKCAHHNEGYAVHAEVMGAVPGLLVSWVAGASEGDDLFEAGATGGPDERVNCPYNTDSGITIGMAPETTEADADGVAHFHYPVAECSIDGAYFGVGYQASANNLQCARSPVVELAELRGIEFVLKVQGDEAAPAEVDTLKMEQFVLEHMVDGNNNGWKKHHKFTVATVDARYTPLTEWYNVGGGGPAAGQPEANTIWITVTVHTDALDLNDFTFDNAVTFLDHMVHNFDRHTGMLNDNNDFDDIRKIGNAFHGRATVQLVDAELWRSVCGRTGCGENAEGA